MQKIAVILFNLGGPDKRESIEPFLLNFFTDPNIIRVPAPMRWLLAKLIAFRRTRNEAGDSYGILGGKSPLLENTIAQAQALEKVLRIEGSEVRTFVTMRYWHPMAPEVVKNVKAYAPDRIVLLPLYPQYSTTTTRSSLQDWQKACRLEGLDVPSSMVCCYPLGKGFIDASALLVREAVEKAKAECGRMPRVLFSAHGLPESIIKEGDPYQWQCEQGAAHIASAAGLKDDEWQICYQSRVGPKKWIAPSADEALHKAASDNVPVLMYPHAFVSEHVETLVEIEHEYRDLAKELGIPWFGRVPTVSVQPAFIAGLADMIKGSLAREEINSDQHKRLCPAGFSQCCQQEFAKGV